VHDGQHRNPDLESRPEWFTTAYLHHPDELRGELEDAGLRSGGGDRKQMSDEVTDFRIEVAEADLEDLRARLRHTCWPERETVEDWSQGVPLTYLEELCGYWANAPGRTKGGRVVDLLGPGAWTVQQGHDLAVRVERDLRERLPYATVFTHVEPREDAASFEDVSLDRSA
jgi:hypothetical protein